MKRLFVLLLICVLPMQMFAGMLTYKPHVDLALAAQKQPPISAAVVGAVDVNDILAHASSVPTDQGDLGGSPAYADRDDVSSHASAGDESVLNPALALISETATLAPMLRSDAPRRPPFLPPAGRPPRI